MQMWKHDGFLNNQVSIQQSHDRADGNRISGTICSFDMVGTFCVGKINYARNWDLFVSVKLIIQEIGVETPLCANIDIITIISKYTCSRCDDTLYCVVLQLRFGNPFILLGYRLNKL
jgi:hypothetical protein